tara:strand:- start:441 stop:2321 length:1881 start_codon:yes stop_codon:yes gene_type:complete
MTKKIIIRQSKTLISQIYFKLLSFDNNQIYFFKPYQIDVYVKDTNNCKGVNEIKLCHELEQNITFKANILTNQYINKELILDDNLFYKVLINKFKTNKILLALKKYSIRNVQDRIRIILIYQHFYNKYPSHDIKIIFSNNFFTKINKYMNFDYYKCTLKWYWFYNFLQSKLNNILYIFLYLPFLITKLITRNGLKIFKPRKKYFDIGQHLANGFSSDELDNIRKFKNSRNDGKLYEYMPKNIKYLFIYSHWKFSSLEKKIFNKKLNSCESSVCDETKLAITPQIIFDVLNDYIKFILCYLKHVILNNHNDLPLRNFYLLLKDGYEHEIFCSYFRTKIFLSRDDYNAKHIIRTIIQNKYKLKHCGIHHSLFLKPYISLIFLHTYYDFFFTHGKGYSELYKNFWHSNEHIIVGNPNKHQILEAIGNIEKKREFKKKYSNKYNILFLLPSIDANTEFNNTEILKKAFSKIHLLLDIGLNIDLILRPRNLKQYHRYTQILKFDKVTSGRVHYELNDFNTYELMAFSNFLIADSTSSSLMEAFSNKKIVIMPYMMRMKSKRDLIWSDYSSNTIFDNIEKMCEYIKTIINRQKSFQEDNDIRQIAHKFAAESDTDSWKFISNEIISKLEEID